MKRNVQIANIILWCLFVVSIAWFKWSYHEMWKDEWQAWFVAKDQSFSEMLSFLNYEGHPLLWYLYLKIWSFVAPFIGSVNALQLGHLVCVIAVYGILFMIFDMPIWQKIGIASSYFLLFEYGLVNRGYILVILILFLIIVKLKSKQTKQFTIPLLLLLLCQTEVYGVFMALGILTYQYFSLVDKTRFKRNALFTFLGLCVFILTVYPRESGHIAKTQSVNLSGWDQFLTAIQGNLSNTFFIGTTLDTFTYGYTLIGLLLSVLVLLMLGYIFYENKSSWMALGLFLLIMISFSSFVFLGGVRQWGMVFIFFVAILELTPQNKILSKYKNVAIALLLIFSTDHGVKAMITEYKIPFSNAKMTGEFLKTNVPEKVPIVTFNKFSTTPVIGYLDRKMYSLPDGEPYSYFRWVDKVYVTTESELRLFTKYKNVKGIIIVADKPIDKNRFPSLMLWESFDTENFKKENYFIYTFEL